MFFNWLSSDKDDHQSIENTTIIQSSQHGNAAAIEESSDNVIEHTTDDENDNNLIQKENQQNKIVETVKSIASKFSKKLEFNITDSFITTKTNDFNALFQFVVKVSIILGLQFKESTITKDKDVLSKNCFFRCCDIGHLHQDRFCCLKFSKGISKDSFSYYIQLSFSNLHYTFKYPVYLARRNRIEQKLKELESLLFNEIEIEAEKYQKVRIKKNKASKICKQRKKKREFLRKASEVLPEISRDIENGNLAVDERAKEEFENYIRIANQLNATDQ